MKQDLYVPSDLSSMSIAIEKRHARNMLSKAKGSKFNIQVADIKI